MLKLAGYSAHVTASQDMIKGWKMKTKHLGNLSLLACAGCWITTETCISAGYLHGNWGIIANAFEAGAIGGLADWFAVSALFREIPIPYVRRHTNIIVKNRRRISDGIADMVQNKWLSPEVVREKLEKTRMIALAMELLERENRNLQEYVVLLLKKLVDGLDDADIVGFLEVAIKERLSDIDFARSLGLWMRRAMESGYNHEIWDLLFDCLQKATQSAQIQEYVALKLQAAAVDEKEKGFLKKVFIGAGEITGGFDYWSASGTLIAQYREVLQEAREEREHLIRRKLDGILRDFARGLENGSPDVTVAFDRFRESIIREADLKKMLARMMTDLKGTISLQLEEKGSPLRSVIDRYVEILLATLRSDPLLQERIDRAIKEAIIIFIEKNHAVIGDMVRTSLDPGRLSDGQMVAEIEEKVGDDLQFIRLNGAVVGWFIGLALGTVKVLLQ
jgi:uncharacterized membrane-anchored protein YjiN (DUF445 family)